jgi:hypothetical protein
MFALHNPNPNVATDTHTKAWDALGAPATIRPPIIASAPTAITLFRAKVAVRPIRSIRSLAAPPIILPISTVR